MFSDHQIDCDGSFASQARSYADRARAQFAERGKRRESLASDRRRTLAERHEIMMMEDVKAIDKKQAEAILSYAVHKHLKFSSSPHDPSLGLSSDDVASLQKKYGIQLDEELVNVLLEGKLPFSTLILSVTGDETFFDEGMVYVGEEGEERVAQWRGQSVEKVLRKLEIPIR